MLCDLLLVKQRCDQLGLQCAFHDNDTLKLPIGRGICLAFMNDRDHDDSLLGFEGTPWHSHDGITCLATDGEWLQFTYDEIPAALAEGALLIREMWRDSELADRSIVHARENSSLKWIQPLEELRIWRANFDKQAL